MENVYFPLRETSVRRAVRVDLHCHSNASNEADEAMLTAIGCPESYSRPEQVYAQAKSRQMDFVTVTDHDSLEGVKTLLAKSDVLTGEEVTCYFPEDQCKIHLLVWGHTADDHAAMQAVAADIYRVAAVVESRNLAHAVAHPVYRQNDRLEKWHLERLVLLFKGFETLNGAHSPLHRDALEPMLDGLTPESITELSDRHEIAPRWPDPHVKARTGGSDDHGLFNIGRTWTEFPPDAGTIPAILDCIRTARCRPGGEAGSSLKLAHNFFGIGIKYYRDRIDTASPAPASSTRSLVFKALVGEGRNGDNRPIRRRDAIKAVVKSKARGLGRKLVRPFRKPVEKTGSALLLDLFLDSCGKHLGGSTALKSAVASGRAALGEHAAMFDFMSAVNRDIAGGIAGSVARSIETGELTGIFDAVSAVVAHQFLQMPYYFALFHQNQERQLLPRITGFGSGRPFRLGVFTDTFDEVNGVGRFIQDMSRTARARGDSMEVLTCTADPRVVCASRKNFTPLLTRPTPFYADQPLTLPPPAEVLEYADRQQFDAIHVHTPGPMGLCGLLAAKMLRVPVLATYHTDFPRYVQNLTGDHRLTIGTTAYMKWFYNQPNVTFTRTKMYRPQLREFGLSDDRMASTPAGVDTTKFDPAHRDLSIWPEHKVDRKYKLFYAGRVSLEKNLPFLVAAFKILTAKRDDVALVVAGDGPYMKAMREATAGLPVHFLGYQTDATLPGLYASSDLFVFPSETDTLGQVVVEAQASGLPVLVSDQGGPQEVMADGVTGRVLTADNAARWADAIDELLTDTPQRLRMSRSGPPRVARLSLDHTFEAFWSEHLKAARRSAEIEAASATPGHREKARPVVAAE
jgi:glycosyltransferase involved in cell wall biosynthesis